MAELVGEAAALTHWVVTARNEDENGTTFRIGHRQAVLIGRRLDNGHVVTSSLLNDPYEVHQGTGTEAVLLTKPLRGLASENLSASPHQRACGIAWSAR